MTVKILKWIDFEPTSTQVSEGELKLLLYSVRRSVLLCWHDWIYWRFGKATKMHRVCKKCYKKQQNNDVVKQSNIWRNERHYA